MFGIIHYLSMQDTSKHILVTGGQGFIGTCVTDYLIDMGYQVTVLDYVDTGMSTANESIQMSCESFVKEQLSAARLPGLSDLLSHDSDFDAVIHLAAIPRVGFSLVNPELVIQNNVESTLAIVQYCVAKEIPLINISSSSVVWADVYSNPYALSKKMCEDLVTLYSKTFGLIATSVRLFNVYGPNDHFAGDFTTLVKQCQTAFETMTPLVINGDGSVKRDFTHVFDVAAALEIILLQAIYEPNDLQPVYEVGTGDARQLLSVKDVVSEFVPFGLNVEYGPPRVGDAPITCANPELLPPGWNPAFDLISHIRGWIMERVKPHSP